MISDTLSDAANEIRDYLSTHEDSYFEYKVRIRELLAVMDGLREELDTPPGAATSKLTGGIKLVVSENFDDAVRRSLRDAFVAGCEASDTRSLFTAGQWADREATKLAPILRALAQAPSSETQTDP